MVLFNLSLPALLAVTSSQGIYGLDLQSLLIVNTNSGIYAPYFPDTHPGVASFPDIQYAQNPTGRLRFSPPVRATPHDNGVVQATSLPAGCFQYVPPFARGGVLDTAENAFELQGGDYHNTTEDCLRLSIFAPKTAVEKAASHNTSGDDDLLPVVIWVHGGQFSWAGNNVPYQLAPNWVQRSQAHVVVQVQYRLNLLGLPNAAGLATGNSSLNLGMLDLRLAIEWVRDNIAHLGGDPHRITLWGQSAGACAADGYLFAWATDPIVSGVIANSGNALAIPGLNSNGSDHSHFSQAASHLGCGGLSPADELACMRAVPADKIQTYLQAAVGAGGAADDGIMFGTVADNITIFTDYEDRLARGAFAAQVPLLVGTNTNEGTAIVPYGFPGSETATQVPASLAQASDKLKLSLQCTALREVHLRAAAGATTHQYLYGGNFSDISPRPWLGAYHTAELPLVFGTYGIRGLATEFEKTVSAQMQDLYLAFVQDPKHGLEKAGWPVATGAAGRAELMEWAVGGKAAQLIEADGMKDECARSAFPLLH